MPQVGGVPQASKQAGRQAGSRRRRRTSLSADVPSLKRLPPMASISSMKMMQGSCARAYLMQGGGRAV